MKGDPPKEPGGTIAERPRPETMTTAPRPSPGPGATRTPAADRPPARSRPASTPRPPLSAKVVRSWIGSDDPILHAFARQRLAPPSPAPPAPATLPELLARIRESPTHVAAAAEALSRDLGDRKSWSGFHAVCRRAWEGRIEPEVLAAAWREATGGRARNPGAVFMAAVKRGSGA